MSETVGRVLPIFVGCDASGSMSEFADHINRGLETVLDAMHERPDASAMLRIGVIDFADEPVVRMALTELSTVEAMPSVRPSGGTDYNAFLSELRPRIETEVARLKREGHIVLRPTLVVLTDGRPNQDGRWATALAALRDPAFRAHPNIVAVGLGDVDTNILTQLATKPQYALVSRDGSDVGAAIAGFFTALADSAVSSAEHIASGDNAFVFTPPTDFVMVADPV